MDAAHAAAEVQKCPAVRSRGTTLRAQSVQKERVQHLQNIGHAGVVHAEGTALLVVGHRLDHRPEDVGFMFCQSRPPACSR